jgi:hypothetical protein
MSRFTPSPPEYDADGISPALRRGPLSYGMPPPNDGVMHDMITSGSMAAAATPGFFTQEEARATEAVAAARGGDDGLGDDTEDVDEEGGHVQIDEEDDAPEPTSRREDAILKLYPRTPGCDWKFAPTHACFTSNPGEYIVGFRPGGLKRLEML